MKTKVKKIPRYSVRKDDQVVVLTGKDRGKRGKVQRVIREKGRLVVEKLNMVKRHSRPTQTSPQGGIVEKEAPINISNVQLVCPKCNEATRVGHRFTSEGKKVRICRKCEDQID
jgi:large subunit ribosomal protein L24